MCPAPCRIRCASRRLRQQRPGVGLAMGISAGEQRLVCLHVWPARQLSRQACTRATPRSLTPGRLHKAGLAAVDPADPALQRLAHTPAPQAGARHVRARPETDAQPARNRTGGSAAVQGPGGRGGVGAQLGVSCPPLGGRRPLLPHLQRSGSAEMTPAPSPNSLELASRRASSSVAKVRAAGGRATRHGGAQRSSQPPAARPPCTRRPLRHL